MLTPVLLFLIFAALAAWIASHFGPLAATA